MMKYNVFMSLLETFEESSDRLFGIRYNSKGKVDYLGHFNANTFEPHGFGVEFFSKTQCYIGEFDNGFFQGKGILKLIESLVLGKSSQGIFKELASEENGKFSFSLWLDNKKLQKCMNGLIEPLKASQDSIYPWNCNQFMREYIDFVIRPRSSSSVNICPQFTESASKWSFLANAVKGFGVFEWYDHVLLPVEKEFFL